MSYPEGSHYPSFELPALELTKTSSFVQRFARLLVGLFFLLLVVLAFTPWQQNVTGMGRVVAYAPLERQQTVQAPVEGRIVNWWVREGSRVQSGERLAEISDNDPGLLKRLEAEQETLLSRIAIIQTRMNAVDNQVQMAERSREMAISAADARIQMAEERKRAALHALEAAEAALATSLLNYDRQHALHIKGLTSTRFYELAQLENNQRRTEVDRAKATLSAAESEVHAIRADRRKTEADTTSGLEKAKADLAKSREELAYAQAEKLKLETRLARQRTQIVTAPRNGTVLRLAVSSQAELVKPGDPLLVLVPDTEERAVELWIDGNDIPLITPGRKVRLQFEGYPAVQFTGWPEVAVGTFGGVVQLIDSTDNGHGNFRLVVLQDHQEPWPNERFLRQGVRANGWILLNQVRLGYEFWRIFNGFPPIILPSYPDWSKKSTSEKKGISDKEGKESL